MKAQEMYDLRSRTGFAGGDELSHFFERQTGDPSPSGNIEIDEREAAWFVVRKLHDMAHNSPSAFGGMLIPVPAVERPGTERLFEMGHDLLRHHPEHSYGYAIMWDDEAHEPVVLGSNDWRVFRISQRRLGFEQYLSEHPEIKVWFRTDYPQPARHLQVEILVLGEQDPSGQEPYLATVRIERDADWEQITVLDGALPDFD